MLKQYTSRFHSNFANILLCALFVLQEGCAHEDDCFPELFGSFVRFDYWKYEEEGSLGEVLVRKPNYKVSFLPNAHAKDDGQPYLQLGCNEYQRQKTCLYEFPDHDGDVFLAEVTVDNAYIGALEFIHFPKEEVEKEYIPNAINIIQCIEASYKTEFDKQYNPTLKELSDHSPQ